jgi:hypothetical protein
VSKFVGKFRPERDYEDNYGFKQNLYERKKKDKQKDSAKKMKYFDQYESDLYSERRERRK